MRDARGRQPHSGGTRRGSHRRARRLGDMLGTNIREPSSIFAARFMFCRSAPGSAPPAALMASVILLPAGSLYTFGTAHRARHLKNHFALRLRGPANRVRISRDYSRPSPATGFAQDNLTTAACGMLGDHDRYRDHRHGNERDNGPYLIPGEVQPEHRSTERLLWTESRALAGRPRPPAAARGRTT